MNIETGFWLFILPNYFLATIMYTLIGRYLLSIFFKADSQLVIWRVFCQLTDPVLGAVRTLTPTVVPPGLVMVLAIVWVIMLRVFLFLALLKLGMAPRVDL